MVGLQTEEEEESKEEAQQPQRRELSDADAREWGRRFDELREREREAARAAEALQRRAQEAAGNQRAHERDVEEAQRMRERWPNSPDKQLRPIQPLNSGGRLGWLRSPWGAAQKKLKAIEMEELTGKDQDWANWRLATDAAFSIVGREETLSGRRMANARSKGNKIAFAQLQRAACKGAARHLAGRHQRAKDCHGAWNGLVKWFKNETNRENRVIKLGADLQDAKLLQGGNAMAFIDKFENALQGIKKAEGEGWANNQAKQAFLENTEDPARKPTIETTNRVKNTTEFSQVAGAIHGKSAELKRQATKRKCLKQRAGCIVKRLRRQDESGQEDTEASGSRARRFQDKKPKASPNTIRLNDSGKICLSKSHRLALSKEHQDFVKSRNCRVGENKDFSGSKFPIEATIKKKE